MKSLVCDGLKQMVRMSMCNKWVLLDDEGEPVRYFNYPAKNTVEIVEKKLSYMELIEELGECLL